MDYVQKLSQNCKFCLQDDTHIPYSTEKICNNGCKFHIDCMDYERHAPIFVYDDDETKPEPMSLKSYCVGDACHGHDIPWIPLKPGPFIWKYSNGTKRAEGTLKEIRNKRFEDPNWIAVKYGFCAPSEGYYGYLLHGPYTEFDERGHIIRSMNYDTGTVVGTFKIHGPITMEQELAPGGKVNGVRKIRLHDGTNITENWRYGVIHGIRTIKNGDRSGSTIEEYENGYLISKIQETHIGGKIIRTNDNNKSVSKLSWFKRKLRNLIK